MFILHFRVLFCLFLMILPGINAACTILVIGDSISAAYGMEINQGWVALLQQKLNQDNKNCTIINSSISGDTSAGGLARINVELDHHKPSIVIIELGGNDGLRGLPPATLKANLEAMIDRAKQARAQIILLGIRIPPNYGKRYTTLFHAVYHQLAEDSDIGFVPFLLEGIGETTELMQHDRVHPNTNAQPLILDLVWKELNPLLNQTITD